MPTTITGLLIFVALLTPGFVYASRVETRFPGQDYSGLREAASVVWVSLRVNGVVLAGFAALRWRWPALAPDLGALLSSPGAYWRDHYAEGVVVGVVLLVASVGLAALVAVPPAWTASVLEWWDVRPARWLREAILRRRRNRIVQESGWGTAFLRYSNKQVYLGLRLRDGTYLYGALSSFDPTLKETGDRSLQLRGPIDIGHPRLRRLSSWPPTR